ncbi:MAG TPA: ABC transporter permease [Dongiaceae bacterium]|jgi:spermidine/putrescine transport system permease protein|nr:ABC transporter permease [Dongiaceae bacterium]
MTTETAAAPPPAPAALSAAEAAAQAVERRAGVRRWLLAAPAVTVIGVCGLMPLLIVLAYSWAKPADYAGVVWRFQPDAWVNLLFQQDIFSDALTPNYAYYSIYLRSVEMAFLTTTLALIVGFPTAYFIATRSPRNRNVWLFLITIPFWSNLLIRIYAIMMIIRDDGYLNHALISLGFIDQPVPIIYTNYAVAYGLIYAYLPLMVMPLYASIEKLDFRLVEAGYDLYASRLKVLWHVIVPLVKPGIVAGCTLVFIPAIGDYIIAQMLGGGNRMMLGNLIAQQFSTARNWPQGSALALGLMSVVMLALMFYAARMQRSRAQ